MALNFNTLAAAPDKIRIEKLIIYNGATQKDITYAPDGTTIVSEVASFSEAPKVRLFLKACNEMKDKDGVVMTNSVGQPAYVDSGQTAVVEFPLSELESLIATVWEPLMTAAYDLLTDLTPEIKWEGR